MRNLKRFLLIAVIPILVTLTYMGIQEWADSLSSRTYMVYPKYPVMYLGNLLLGVMLYVLIDRTRKGSKGDGWFLIIGFLLNLFSILWTWRPFLRGVRLPLPWWVFHAEPYSVILMAVYGCLLIRWSKGRRGTGNYI